MKYLKIQNTGELDIRLVALMGGTTKQNDKFKIGKFGTGLKYTLAYLYRNNIDFKCFSGSEEVKIHLEKEIIGETTFEIICINNQRTSITTQMGHDWTAWMIIRELWCNAMDEGGNERAVVYKEENVVGDAGKTSFYIQLTPEINEVIENWNTYFLHKEQPLFEDDNYGIYLSNGPLKLYKHGVLIFQMPHTVSLFNYDIKGASINELREFKGIVALEIRQALQNPSIDVINYFFSHIKEEHYEAADMDYDWYVSFGQVWREAIGAQKVISSSSYDHAVESGINKEQLEKAIQLPKKVYEAITKQFEGVGVLRRADRDTDFYEGKDALLEAKTEEVLEILKSGGYELAAEVKILYGLFSKKGVFIAINRNKKEVMISQECYPLETTEFAAKLVYYSERLATDFEDYKLAEHVVKMWTSAIMSVSQTHVIP